MHEYEKATPMLAQRCRRFEMPPHKPGKSERPKAMRLKIKAYNRRQALKIAGVAALLIVLYGTFNVAMYFWAFGHLPWM